MLKESLNNPLEEDLQTLERLTTPIVFFCLRIKMSRCALRIVDNKE
jgi:hypothetical protein